MVRWLTIALILAVVAPGSARADEPLALRRSWAGNLDFFSTGAPLATDSDNDGKVDMLAQPGKVTVGALEVPPGAALDAAYLYWGATQVASGCDAAKLDQEVTFTPAGGGAALVFEFSDPDGDGGVSGASDRIDLAAGVEYSLGVRFVNSLAEPPDDITEEVKAEAEDHLVFVLGDVAGPASTAPSALVTHAYADRESDYGANAVGDDLPVGLVNTITAKDPGSGELRLILRHLPALNGQPQKSGDLPGELAAGRDLPGGVDVDISFELVVS